MSLEGTWGCVFHCETLSFRLSGESLRGELRPGVGTKREGGGERKKEGGREDEYLEFEPCHIDRWTRLPNRSSVSLHQHSITA